VRWPPALAVWLEVFFGPFQLMGLHQLCILFDEGTLAVMLLLVGDVPGDGIEFRM
jgi:hypothetical protein